MERLPFTIDAKLLRELGERLVGKPSIALGELIKNSYDADAEVVNIQFDQSDNGSIVVSDNGHGMTFDEFKGYWMRIGSTHKEKWHYSPIHSRILTGQKGIGRLAVQFLAEELQLTTTSYENTKERLTAFIRWEDAISAGDLVKATVEVDTETGEFEQGTEVKLMGLRHEWSQEDFKELAKDIWILVPPFKSFQTEHGKFEVNLAAPEEGWKETFNAQMSAISKVYEGKIVGKNSNGHVNVSLMHTDWGQKNYEYRISDIPGVFLPNGKELVGGEFEIRFYRLMGRQPFGISVVDLRAYMDDFHGVHIYDAGFHLPYYGQKEGDWLGISDEQARRIGVSDILPEKYHVDDGLTRLPALRRTLGIVKINTSEEPGLEIAISRDRLVDTKTFRALKGMVRYAMHLYAMEDQKHNIEKSRKDSIMDFPSYKVESVSQVLEGYRKEIPDPIYDDIKTNVEKAIEATERKEKSYEDKISFLGAFATAGISSLAYHHQIQQQLQTIEGVSEDIRRMVDEGRIDDSELREISLELKEWAEKARQLEALFSYYGDADGISNREVFNAADVIDEIVRQLRGFLRDVEVINAIPRDVSLPKASLVEWGTIFHNVLFNAYNAISAKENTCRKIQILYTENNTERAILVQDTGIGVNLKKSNELFDPFKRELDLPNEKKALGYGGSGIGLTIVNRNSAI